MNVTIARLNDAFRRFPFGAGGRIVMTRAVAAQPDDVVRRLLGAVQTFDAFTPDNDPHHEHDFGTVADGDVECFWKIDYYESAACEFGAEDPANAYRVLTLMLKSDY